MDRASFELFADAVNADQARVELAAMSELWKPPIRTVRRIASELRRRCWMRSG